MATTTIQTGINHHWKAHLLASFDEAADIAKQLFSDVVAEHNEDEHQSTVNISTSL